MKKILLLALSLLGVGAMQAQDTVLLTIDNEPVKVSEFMYVYNKNNRESSLEQKTMDEYLELFINFKLKVHEAKVRGIDTTQAFLEELKGYRAQATPKYLRDDEAIDSLIRMSYDRMSRDRRAAHIAIQCPEGSSDSAVAAAMAKIEEARMRVTKGGANFSAVAREVSSDPNVQETGGELGWIPPFRFVYALEDAIYNTPVGEVTPVIRSPYGFHIALVEEERPHTEVHAAHIMKMVPRNNDSIAMIKKAEIDEIYQRALNGEDFAELAKSTSDDKGSAMRGGDLGWFGHGMMVKPFEDAAFSMQDSTIGAPFRSDFGWHFIYKLGTRSIQPLEEMRSEIEKRVNRDERINEAQKSFIRKTRQEYQLSADMSDEDVMAYADQHLEEKYPDFRNLVNEYHDGILLFDVSVEEVWDKAGKDTAGLTRFFQENKKKYTWDEPRYKGYVVYCKDEACAKAAKAIIKNSNPDSIASYINQRINLDSVTYVKFNRGLWKKGQNKAVDKYGFKLKKAEYTAKEDLPIVFTIGKIMKKPMDYTDDRGRVVTDYQDYLDQKWVEDLRQKYIVTIDKAVFEQLKAQH